MVHLLIAKKEQTSKGESNAQLLGHDVGYYGYEWSVAGQTEALRS